MKKGRSISTRGCRKFRTERSSVT